MSQSSSHYKTDTVTVTREGRGMTDIEKEKLNDLLYCIDGMSAEYSQGNYGNANDWMRHIFNAYQEYQESSSEEG